MSEKKKMETDQYDLASNIDLESNIGFLVSDAHRLVTAVVDKVMSPLGLTRSQLRVLLYLMRKDGCTQVELAEQLGIGKVAMGGLLDRLEEKKLIKRKENEKDRRAKHIFLTREVEKLYAPMLDLGGDLMDRLLKGFSPAERKQFAQQLELFNLNCRDILEDD